MDLGSEPIGTTADRTSTTKIDLKTAQRKEQSIGQSIYNICSDKPNNLIPPDKDQANDPMSFVPIFHSDSTRIEIFQ
jgi:hypothetical protein